MNRTRALAAATLAVLTVGCGGPDAAPAPPATWLREPVTAVRTSTLAAGPERTDPEIANPYGDDPGALTQGRQLFNGFNCAGCHGSAGGGGMGPPLADADWIYGDSDAQIYASIVQGRPNGMPSFGQALTGEAVWKLAAYVKSLGPARVRIRAAAPRRPAARVAGSKPAAVRVTDWSAGPAAERIGDLFWAMTVLGGIVFVIFCLGLAYALWHRRQPVDPPATERDRKGTRMILLLGGIVPTIILVPLFLWTVRTLAAIDPRAEEPDLVVDLVGKQWWWEIRYRDTVPGRVFVTANELHVPVGRRVELRLTSTDVIHSFWVPELQGKTDLIPGRENVTWIQADRPGVYGGRCAEYCGMQHTAMGLLVVAQPEDEFEAWAAGQRRAAAEPRDSLAGRGRQAFLASGCALCHRVRGTSAGGLLGPDLTHVASRRTLASALLPNTPGHLGGWIANPQALKPGSHMPRVPMSREEFSLIHQYLLTLE